MSGEVFTDPSMLEIFRAEVETHVEALTKGLLALERDPGDTSHIDEMMRGAHSIKGAARIVGVDPAVRVAHVMEDGFIAAQNGKLTLRPDHVDVLLRGVDMLSRIANSSKNASVDWAQFDAETPPMVAEITAVLSGQASPAATRTVAVTAPAPSVVAPVPSSATAAAPAKLAAQPNDLTITLPPLLDVAAADTARRSFVVGLETGARVVRWDLSATADVDAIGLALLAAVPAQVAHGGPRVELVGVSSELRTVLQATGVDRLYPAGGA